ncbi:MAG TPA: KEOPS complex subunit Pcc1 [Candidatus Bathyarchaeia archaeon]|nr:KEOPS complex subunit Pcc1 [Candidatus Bathyarchaeia archaeon]
MRATAKIHLRFPSGKQLSAIFTALKAEARSPVTSRSKVAVVKEDKTLTLTMIFEAKDTSALRAALNSYLHWVRLSMDVLQALEAS